MAKRHWKSLSNLRRLLKLKLPLGHEYVPALLATPRAAPKISSPSILDSAKLARSVHCLSQAERACATLALYHPDLVDFHEQWVLPMDRSPHPLSKHPECIGRSLPTFEGTVRVAERLGAVDRHLFIRVENKPVPFPYINDQLLYLRDRTQLRCVNWNIKSNERGFLKRRPDISIPRDPEKARESAIWRNTLERETFRDAELPTKEINADQIAPMLASNLKWLWGWHGRTHGIPPATVRTLESYFQSALEERVPPIEVQLFVSERLNIPTQSSKAVLLQAIWNRRIRVNLFEPFNVDFPLPPEKVDLVEHFKGWFSQ